MQLNNSIVTNKKNETLNNHLEMTNVPEIKPVSIQDAEKAAASVKWVAIIQTFKKKSSLEHLAK